MAVSITQTVGGASTGTSQALTISVPVSGHLLVVVHYCGGTATPTGPTGFTQGKQTAAATAGKTTVWWRVADASEGTSLSVGSGASSVLNAAVFFELDAGQAWSATPTHTDGESSGAAATSGTVTASAATTVANTYAVVGVGVAATVTFDNLWNGGFARIGSVVGPNRLEVAAKESAAVETFSTTESWGVTSTAPRMALQSFVIPAFAAPTGLSATAISSTAIDVSWTAGAGAASYDVERDGVIVASSFVGTTYHDTGLTPATLYSYRVRSVA